MGASEDDKSRFRSVRPEIAPKNNEGESLVDLYVYLPRNRKFIKWVQKGEHVDPSHVKKIKNHSDPHFYTIENDVDDDTLINNGKIHNIDEYMEFKSENNEEAEDKVFQGVTQEYESARLAVDPNSPKTKHKDDEARKSNSQINHLESLKMLYGDDTAEALAEPIDSQLKQIYQEIGSSKPGNFTLQDSGLEVLSEKLCNIVSPEVGDVRNHLKSIPAFVSIMDESSAISALAMLFAIAQGQKARGVFKDLSYACLLMDISLVGHDSLKNRWYADPAVLKDEEIAILESHPRKSQAVIMEKFKNLPEIVGQMILGHHELFNGRGFPRKIRSDILPPVVRILSFAVDVYYHMKNAEFNGKNASVEEIIESFIDPKVEPHLRRHNVSLCKKILKYSIEGDAE